MRPPARRRRCGPAARPPRTPPPTPERRVRRPRPRRDDDDARPPGQPAVDLGRDGGVVLVLDRDRPDLRRIRQRVIEIDNVVAVEPEKGIHPVRQQARHDRLTGTHPRRHDPPISLNQRAVCVATIPHARPMTR